jgi:hypothetical protein
LSIDYRYEIKFVLDNSKLSEVMMWLYNYTFAKEIYKKRTVNNLYIDDIYYTSAKDNLAGISDRKKMRLRWYGQDNITNQLFFEIKKKIGRIGYKKVYPINSLKKNTMDLNIKNILIQCNKELEKNNLYFDEYLTPTLYTSYDREYYSDTDGIRITIDKNIHFYRPLIYKKLNEIITTPYSNQIMEIKFEPNLKKRVSELIKYLNITPNRHSKYLVGLAMMGELVYI